MSLTQVVGIVGGGLVAFLKYAELVFDLLDVLIEVLIRLPFTQSIRRRPDSGFRGTPAPRGDRHKDGTPVRTNAR
jgi:hypothetical protein